jgi:hypothetical protein
MERILTGPGASFKDSTYTGVTDILHGGTGVTTRGLVPIVLGLLTENSIGQPGGAATLDANGFIKSAQVPGFTNYPTLKGPKTLYMGQVASYEITNYNRDTVYTVAATDGTISRNTETVTYTAPSTEGIAGFTINGRSIMIPVTVLKPVTPTADVTLTKAGDTYNAAVQASNFVSPDGVRTHQNTDWVVARDLAMTDVVTSSMADAVNKTSWTATGIPSGRGYFLKFRYRDSNNSVSDWSTKLIDL